MPAILHTYCLLLPEDERGQQRRIEFEALDPSRAIYLAQQLAPGRNIELREGERSLGIIRHAHEGFWLLWPTAPKPAAAAPRDDPPPPRGRTIRGAPA